MVGVGFEPSSELRVKKNRKETTIIEVNTIYSPVLLNGWDLYMARPSPEQRQRRQTDRKKDSEQNKPQFTWTPAGNFKVNMYQH